METSDVCVAVSSQYPIGIVEPILSSEKQVHTASSLELIENGLSSDSPMHRCLDRGLGIINLYGTREVDMMKFAGLEASPNDQFEYDIAIPSPPPNRRYKVKLNIKTIQKGKPTIVDSDWI